MPAYSDMSYDKLLLDGLRIVSYTPGDGPLTNDGLAKAMTMNENLKTLGYTLNPQDLIRIARSPSADTLYERVSGMMTGVAAKPMYPDFPTQVMEMDEAQFRMHQMIHYFTTYGLEELSGYEVSRGWLPAEAGIVTDTEKTEEDTTLLNAKVLGLVAEGEKYTRPFEDILAKRERMTLEEKEIVKRCAESGKLRFDKKINVPFKENLESTFLTIAIAGSEGKIPRRDASLALYNICQHPGDVTRNLHRYLVGSHYSLRTSEKKMFVSLYDMFDNRAFRENLIVPKSRVGFTKELFRRISFSRYTKDPDKAKAVADIGKEKTWEAKARDMFTSHDPDAVKFAAQRPGMLLRMTSMALRNGYSEKEITEELVKKSCDISAQTLVAQICAARRGPSDVLSTGARKTQEALNRELSMARDAEQVLKRGNSRPGLADVVGRRADALEEKLKKTAAKEEDRIKKKNETRGMQDRIFTEVLKDRLSRVETGLDGKTVFLDRQYDLTRMDADPSRKSMDQGYLPARTAMKIPDGVERIRCFVYWNDTRSVDLDLHAMAVTPDGRAFRVGWDSDFKKNGIVSSGDITHSNAAEYIDVDMKKAEGSVVDLRLHLYGSHSLRDRDDLPYKGFDEIDTCYVGLMAVDRIGQNVRLYDPKNCFVSRDITNSCRTISIGALDTRDRTLYFEGIEIGDYAKPIDQDKLGLNTPAFSLKEYLDILIEAQGGRYTDDPEKADVVLTLTKPANEKEVSLIDSNYFFEAKPKELDDRALIVEQVKDAIEKGVSPDERVLIIEQVKEAVEKGVSPDEITILSYTKKDLDSIESALREAGLPTTSCSPVPVPAPVFDSPYTRAYVEEYDRDTMTALVGEDDKRTVVLMDPKTGGVYTADKDNPGGYRVEGKDLVGTVMGLEENAAPKDYTRVMKLCEDRELLKSVVDDKMDRLRSREPDR